MNDRRFPVARVLLALALSAGPSAGLAADSTTTTLNTQIQQTDTLATTNQGAVTTRISSDFSTFAGSTENANALVTGLRSGSAITLTSTTTQSTTTTTTTTPTTTTTSTTFTPPTGKMGYGNVYTSLALAQQQLAGVGITQPTAQEIEAALVGGTVTGSNGQTTTLTGVLELRAQGMGWGQIAQHYGYKLGPVISGMRSSNAAVSAQTARGAAATTATTSTATNAAGGKSGVVTAAGTTGSGQGRAYGRGIVTGAGTSTTSGHGNAYGRGIVSGAGGMAGQAGAAAGGQGKALGKGH